MGVKFGLSQQGETEKRMIGKYSDIADRKQQEAADTAITRNCTKCHPHGNEMGVTSSMHLEMRNILPDALWPWG
jgi:hypothetical protein